MGVVWSDFNGDGTFTDVALLAGTALSEDGKEQGSMGVAVGDYDHSGGWSLLVTNFADEYNAFYRHDKDFQFTDVSFASQTAKPGIPLVGWGTHFLDYDDDGWLDLLVVNVYPQVERTGDGFGRFLRTHSSRSWKVRARRRQFSQRGREHDECRSREDGALTDDGGRRGASGRITTVPNSHEVPSTSTA